MAVDYDNAVTNSGSGTAISATLTVQANALVVVGIFVQSSAAITAPTFNGVAMTQLLNKDGYLYLYYAYGAPAGSRVAACTRTGSGDWAMLAISLIGADSTTPIGTPQQVENTEGTSLTTPTITGSATGMYVDLCFMITNEMDANVGQTERAAIDSIIDSFQSIGMSTKPGAGSTTMNWTAGFTAGDNFLIGIPILPSAGGTEVTKTPTTANLSLGGRAVLTSAFQNVRIREVLINESGQPIQIANARLMVWYGGICLGLPDVSLNAQTSDANGTTSWSIATGTLTNGASIFYVAQDSISFSNYTCGRIVPSYE